MEEVIAPIEEEKPMTPVEMKNAREILKVTQVGLAEKLDTSDRYITYHESGKRPISRILKYAVYWLLLPKEIKDEHLPKL